MQDLIGQTLGHYRIVEKIGAGGMGEVYRAHDERLDREVAIKVLPEDVAEDPQRLARFEREAKALAALNHPNIATVFGFEKIESGEGGSTQTFLVMELLEGDSFRELISAGGLTTGKAVEYAGIIAGGLAAAHDKGITHRDLKPENLFLTKDGRVKILDFGLAKLTLPEGDLTTATPTGTLDTAPGKILGTVAYMAPEQVDGQPADHRSDIFALGVVLYEMLTGKRPFRGATSASTAAAILKEDPEPISVTSPGIPPTLAGVVSKCLEKRPQDRFSSAHDLSLTLGALDTTAVSPVPRRSLIGRRWPHILAVVFAVVIALLVILPPEAIFDRGTDTVEYPPSSDDKSIAVLPFLNMSDASNEYFSDGISEELLGLLAKIPELRVISRTSAFSYKGKELKAAQIAEELNVANILEGSVRMSGNQVRITAQLIDARSDTNLWSDSYDRTLDDVFAVQDEIAAAVVEQMKVKLLGEPPRVEATDPEAYSLYLQARHLGRQREAESLEQSNALYKQVIQIDPNYAGAWLGLAANYSTQSVYGMMHPASEGYRLCREAAERGLAIDPSNPEAHARLGRIALSFDHDLAAAARHFSKALELDPGNIDTLSSAAILVRALGRADEAVSIMEYVVARDPVNARSHQRLAAAYYYAGRFDDAIASQRTTLKLSPGSAAAHSGMSLDLMLNGEPQAALEEIQQEPIDEYRLVDLAMIYHTLGRVADSEAMLQQVLTLDERDWSYNIAYVEAYLGNNDEAFEWLHRAVRYNDPGLSDLPVEVHLFHSLRDDPRWPPFLESIGKSPKQLAAIKFEVTLPG
jgi:serine/threonine protein kinase/lipoprotein NlpI